jgi:UDP-glucose 4-epimerase
MSILVTGGAGYIGSHTSIALLKAGYSVIIADNFCNSRPEMIQKIEQLVGKKVIFYEVDVTNEQACQSNFYSSSNRWYHSFCWS